ncbi:MAG: Rrf2 family transcriptional regulator [Planctomycetia bacterium]|nr:Rrf2 family transcriptional regulator [Planctomycetia bacterium]
MKVSTKTRYGVRAMVELGLHYGEPPLRGPSIAERLHISLKYLEQVIASLKAHGLIESTRGARGGYNLSRPPAKIRLGEIFRALEGSVAPVDCIDNPEGCSMHPECVSRDIWSEVGDAIAQVLDSTTLHDVVQRKREKCAASLSMYYI